MKNYALLHNRENDEHLDESSQNYYLVEDHLFRRVVGSGLNVSQERRLLVALGRRCLRCAGMLTMVIDYGTNLHHG
jgi:hypothetical protein